MSVRDTILAANDRPTHPVEVPDWGVTVYVSMLTINEVVKGRTMPLLDLALLTLKDEAGALVFKPEDIATVKETKGHKSTSAILEKFIEVNGLSSEAVDTAAKN